MNNEELRYWQNYIRNFYNEETILIEDLNLNFFKKILFFFSKKEIIVFNNDRLGFHPSITIKRFNNHKVLLNFTKGSAKELL